MKTLHATITAVIALTFFFTPCARSQGQTVQSVFNEGVALFNQQDYVAALEKFEKVLQAKPGFVYARNYAGKCRAEIAKGAGPKNETEARVAQVIIPEINLTDAPIGDVLTYLTDRAGELTGGKFVPNFIYKGTSEQRAETLISLSLRNVPMTEAIRYIGQLSRTDFRYDAHAIVATPREGQTAPTPTTTTTDESSGTVLGTPGKSIFD